MKGNDGEVNLRYIISTFVNVATYPTTYNNNMLIKIFFNKIILKNWLGRKMRIPKPSLASLS
jgi:hypothetical protein